VVDELNYSEGKHDEAFLVMQACDYSAFINHKDPKEHDEFHKELNRIKEELKEQLTLIEKFEAEHK